MIIGVFCLALQIKVGLPVADVSVNFFLYCGEVLFAFAKGRNHAQNRCGENHSHGYVKARKPIVPSDAFCASRAKARASHAGIDDDLVLFELVLAFSLVQYFIDVQDLLPRPAVIVVPGVCDFFFVAHLFIIALEIRYPKTDLALYNAVCRNWQPNTAMTEDQQNSDHPLHCAAKSGDMTMLQRLIAEGADVNQQQGESRYTPLHSAAMKGHAQAINALVKAGATVNATGEDGDTPLLSAAAGGHTQAVAALVNAGADVNLADEVVGTPLHSAARMGHAQVITALVSAGAAVNRRELCSGTPLHAAASSGHVQAITALIKAGADVNAADEDVGTPLHSAALMGHAQAITALVRMGADDNGQTGKGKSWTAKLRQAITGLFGAGVDVNRRDEYGRTPLHTAAARKRAQAITALVNAGASVNLADEDGCTPLHAAATSSGRGCVETITALVNAGAVVHRQDTCGNTPLHRAATMGRAQAITALAGVGASVNATNKNGVSPLHAAALGGHAEAIVALAKAGADINQETINGDTPLYLAAYNGCKSAIAELTKLGARSKLPPGSYPVFPSPTEPKSQCGYIYVAANESLGDDVVKIGMTTRNPEERKAELFNTNIPTPFVFLLILAASNAKGAERIIHRALDDHRINEGREFFRITPEKLESVLSELAGKPIKMTAKE